MGRDHGRAIGRSGRVLLSDMARTSAMPAPVDEVHGYGSRFTRFFPRLGGLAAAPWMGPVCVRARPPRRAAASRGPRRDAACTGRPAAGRRVYVPAGAGGTAGRPAPARKREAPDVGKSGSREAGDAHEARNSAGSPGGCGWSPHRFRGAATADPRRFSPPRRPRRCLHRESGRISRSPRDGGNPAAAVSFSYRPHMTSSSEAFSGRLGDPSLPARVTWLRREAVPLFSRGTARSGDASPIRVS
jgi:hypothetical protein